MMQNEKEERREVNEKLARHFLDKKIKVHITLINGGFYNGLISEVGHDFFFMVDREDGTKLIFFKDLKKPLEEFQERT